MSHRFKNFLLVALLIILGLTLFNSTSSAQDNIVVNDTYTQTDTGTTVQTFVLDTSTNTSNLLVTDDATEAFILRELSYPYEGDDTSKDLKDGLTIRVYRPTGTCTGGVLTRVVVRVIIVQSGPNDGNEYRAVLEGACLNYDPNSPNGTTVVWTDVESTPWAEELPDVNIDEQMPGTKRIFRVRVECRPIGGGPVTIIKRYVTVSFVCNRRPNGPAFSPQLQREQQSHIQGG